MTLGRTSELLAEDGAGVSAARKGAETQREAIKGKKRFTECWSLADQFWIAAGSLKEGLFFEVLKDCPKALLQGDATCT